MNWVFLAVTIFCLAYLMLIIVSFVEQYKNNKEKVEQTVIDIKRLESQLKESEHARLEAEKRTTDMESEALNLESQTSELHQRINEKMPSKDEPTSS